ncbi:MAG: Flp family type IVb pilin [Pseudomonadota bacterium]
MTKFRKRFARDESGATAIEYGLIAAFIALAVIFGATSTGQALANIFNNIAAAF